METLHTAPLHYSPSVHPPADRQASIDWSTPENRDGEAAPGPPYREIDSRTITRANDASAETGRAIESAIMELEEEEGKVAERERWRRWECFHSYLIGHAPPPPPVLHHTELEYIILFPSRHFKGCS